MRKSRTGERGLYSAPDNNTYSFVQVLGHSIMIFNIMIINIKDLIATLGIKYLFAALSIFCIRHEGSK